MNTYTQCKITKENKHRIAWIPSRYAILETIIKIRIDGLWKDGWQVAEVYGTSSKEHVEAHERDFRKQRKASDI